VRASGTATPVVVVLVLGALAACGQKGPPLAPLRLVPAPATELGARRSGDDVQLRFVLPTANANGPEAIDLARVEIYAMTVGAGAVAPPNRDLLTAERVVGTVAVRPPPVEGESPEADAAQDKRPAPGEPVVFVDQLTPEKMTPVVVALPPAPASAKPEPAAAAQKAEAGADPAAGAATPPPGQKPDAAKPDAAKPEAAKPEATKPGAPVAPDAAKPDAAKPDAAKPDAAKPDAATPQAGTQKPEAPAAAPPAPAGVPYPTRIYAVRGLSRGGRPGPASTRVVVPLLAPVAAPTAVTAQLPTAQAVLVDWTPPAAEPGLPPLAFNIYRRDATGAPLNPAPVPEAKFEIGGVEYGKEQCFVVRTVQVFESVSVESAPSAPACLTPLDKFPPAPPQGLRAVAEDGAVSLVWEQSAEPDLAGYLVLRGEAPGDTLQPLTPQPVSDASFRDTTAKPGVRYVYAVIAVDNATPSNESSQSAREEVTAR
jgi:predicted small lipoprotein YifL